MLTITGVATNNEAMFLNLGVVLHLPAESHLGELLNMQIFRLQLRLTKSEHLVVVALFYKRTSRDSDEN